MRDLVWCGGNMRSMDTPAPGKITAVLSFIERERKNDDHVHDLFIRSFRLRR